MSGWAPRQDWDPGCRCGGGVSPAPGSFCREVCFPLRGEPTAQPRVYWGAQKERPCGTESSVRGWWERLPPGCPVPAAAPLLLGPVPQMHPRASSPRGRRRARRARRLCLQDLRSGLGHEVQASAPSETQRTMSQFPGALCPGLPPRRVHRPLAVMVFRLEAHCSPLVGRVGWPHSFALRPRPPPVLLLHERKPLRKGACGALRASARSPFCGPALPWVPAAPGRWGTALEQTADCGV